MTKKFNVNGVCRPELHYMVDLSSRLAVIRKMVEEGAYFTIIRRASTERRQYFGHWHIFCKESMRL